MWYKIKFLIAVITLSLVDNPGHASLGGAAVILQQNFDGAPLQQVVITLASTPVWRAR